MDLLSTLHRGAFVLAARKTVGTHGRSRVRWLMPRQLAALLAVLSIVISTASRSAPIERLVANGTLNGGGDIVSQYDYATDLLTWTGATGADIDFVGPECLVPTPPPTCSILVQNGLAEFDALIDHSGNLLYGQFTLVGSVPSEGILQPTLIYQGIAIDYAAIVFDVEDCGLGDGPQCPAGTQQGFVNEYVDLHNTYVNPVLTDWGPDVELNHEGLTGQCGAPFDGSFSAGLFSSSWGSCAPLNSYIYAFAVPEPSALALFALGLVSLGFARSRRPR